MATLTAIGAKVESGLRPTDLRRDLNGIAALMEVCFGATMDAAGRGAINEMRLLSRAGPLLWLMGNAFKGPLWNLGFIWTQDGRLVGNISTQRASNNSRNWLIANVAVHPEYRRLGIARALTAAALNLARRVNGESALLQVNHDNEGALRLYTSLGFQRYGARTEWVRYGSTPPAYEPTPGIEIRPRRPRMWADEFLLANTAAPEGLDWMRPLRPDDFQSSLLRTLGRVLAGQNEEHWVALVGGRLVGSLAIVSIPGENDQFTLLAHPEWRERVARPLLVRGLRRLGVRPWPLRLDYPPHDLIETLQALGFSAGRTLIWMRQSLR